ncbi:LuxR C-terminal-related transcriptional regulator [Caulobacter sp. S45]|jgi:two-component system response regulator FixJ|uniref:LuxR C-terminal-related transcriptional regulator n=1 Tax=Caulobacter sp. S45 TaxID=1641861 RepID=UPI00131C17A4|nr:helix-turn-helix transcriptional regulator [Caulobacter sp. S45]
MLTSTSMNVAWLRDAYGLTHKELEVVSHLLDAKSSKQIAYDLHLCVPTVEIHRAHIRQKMGVNNTAGVFHVIMTGPTPDLHA